VSHFLPLRFVNQKRATRIIEQSFGVFEILWADLEKELMSAQGTHHWTRDSS
jgi:hypothetical protein